MKNENVIKSARKKRDLFSELMIGIKELKAHREGKIQLKTTRIDLLKSVK